jgi:hypothetical protein
MTSLDSILLPGVFVPENLYHLVIKKIFGEINMDHVVYVDAVAKEMEKLLEGTKTMILRGAAGRKITIDRSQYGNMDDWLPVDRIETVIKK